jgi:hypothetical protein
VEEADLNDHPNLLRLVSLDRQIALALASSVEPSSDPETSAWETAMDYVKRRNQLRMQKAALERTRDTIREVAKCMRKAVPTCFETGERISGW